MMTTGEPALPFFLGTGFAQSRDAFATLDAFLESGGRDLDTARVYGDSEATIGAWIASRGIADRVRILTKGGHPDLERWEPRLAAADVLADLGTSLGLLRADVVECYVLHRDDPATPVDDIAATLSSIVVSGRARSIGVSNWSVPRVAALADALAQAGGPPLTWVSNYYGLAEANPSYPYPGVDTADRDLWPLARRLGFRVLAWSAQSSGYFAGASVPHFDGPESRRRRDVLVRVAAAHRVPALAVLTRWLLTADPRLVPVVGASSPEHTRELVAWAGDDALDGPVGELVAAVGEILPDPGTLR